MLGVSTGCSAESRADCIKILVVDDEEGFATFVKALIPNEGYSVRTATDGEDGYHGYLHFRPDVVITDIQMPGRDGFELMRDIRTHNPEARAIYMSGNLGLFQSALEEEKTKHQVRFLEKPFSRSELVGLLPKNPV